MGSAGSNFCLVNKFVIISMYYEIMDYVFYIGIH